MYKVLMQKNLSSSASFAFLGITKYAREVAGDKFYVSTCVRKKQSPIKDKYF